VYLKVSRVELARRITTRTDHFASPTILASQLATLEEPAADETDIFTIAADHSVEDIVETVRRVTFRNTR
jgi:gluconokinase